MAPKQNSDFFKNNIIILRDYHPYWIIPKVYKNPKIDDITYKIMDLKEETSHNHSKSVTFFTTVLSLELTNYIFNLDEIIAAIVPSHEKGKLSTGLRAIVRNLKQNYNIINEKNPLVRHTTIAKLSSGGDRSKEVHLGSICVDVNIDLKGRVVLLIDDVTTSGNSLIACTDLLYQAGASCVINIALAKTNHE